MNQTAEKILADRKRNSADKQSLVFPPQFGTIGRHKFTSEFHDLVDEVGLNQGIGIKDSQRRVVFIR